MLRHGFLLLYGSMQKTQHTQCNHDQESRIALYCKFCECFGIVYTEYWDSKATHPFQIDLQIHADNGLEPVDSIRLCEVPEGDQLVLNYCSHCKRILSSPYDMDYIELMTNYKPKLFKN